jgi:hypothetical protein
MAITPPQEHHGGVRKLLGQLTPLFPLSREHRLLTAAHAATRAAAHRRPPPTSPDPPPRHPNWVPNHAGYLLVQIRAKPMAGNALLHFSGEASPCAAV